MPSILNTSVSALLSFQRGIETTGHNIANASTPGYSRQRVDLETRPPGMVGNQYIGAGVDVGNVRRIYDQFLGNELAAATTSQSRLDTLARLSGQVDNLLADPSVGLAPAIQNFFNAVQDAAGDPASVPARQALVSQADTLASSFGFIDDRLQSLEQDINGRLNQSVTDVNELATAIAELNRRIVSAEAGVSGQPNDLLDQRDLLVRRLSEQVAVTTLPQDDGALNVFIGNGQTLVTGSQARQLATRPNEFDPGRLEVVYEGDAGTGALGGELTGGAIGGMMDFRRLVLDPTRTAIGETAVALATAFNEQHAAGMDLKGRLGGEFFGVGDPTVMVSSRNGGTASVDATVADVSGLQSTDYRLSYDGSAWSLARADNGEAIPMSGSGTAADPFLAGGLEITVGAGAAAGDRYLIQPAKGAAGTLSRTVADAQSVALAAPVRTATGSGNVGDAQVSAGEVTDPADPALLAGAVIEFTAPNTYTIDGAGSYTYTSGDPIDVNGSRVVITGTPAAGDVFRIESNTGGTGDNRNALGLADVQTRGLLAGGTVAVSESYGRLVAEVGTVSRQAQIGLDAQTVVRDDAEQALMNKSGVNLDEEAANLMRYQQAYQAAAQVIGVTNTLFETLIGAFRR